jgi:amidase/6-aminohexanoate-cyclic-dimer hydrolase
MPVSLRSTYLESDAVDLATAMAAGHLTAAEVLETAIELAEEHNPKLNAIVVEAYDRARKHIASGLPQGPLTGVPFLLKDLYAGLDGLRMTNGNRMYADYVPDHDSELAKRYEAAGLVIFGRSASPEFGLTTSTESILHGATRNPWNLERTSGGSSGGASSAVAAGIVPVAHASDGGGSIRIPASCCGLFGMKPTRARVPAGPDVGEGWSGFSANHVVSRTVRDSALFLDVAAGPELGDPYFAPPVARPFLEEVGRPPGKLRIAWTTRSFNGSETDPECVRAVDSTAILLSELGHEVFEASPEIDSVRLGGATRIIVGANLLATLEQRAGELGRELDPEQDCEPLSWALAHGICKEGPQAYAAAIRVAHATGRQVARFFDQTCDLLLTPTMAAPPQRIGALALTHEDGKVYNQNLQRTIGFTQLMNVAGNPAMSVPLHWSEEGLPVGLQFAAPFGGEAVLFRLAAQLEEARPWRQKRPDAFSG